MVVIFWTSINLSSCTGEVARIMWLTFYPKLPMESNTREGSEKKTVDAIKKGSEQLRALYLGYSL